jgi:8-oxo-dGTP pyrophosphatase MutT (NUDIX family)
VPGGKVFDTVQEYLPYLRGEGVSAVDNQLMEHIEESARREASEEVGARLGPLEYLGKSVCGATVRWDLHYFVADAIELGRQALESGESIEVVELPLADANKIAQSSRMSEERSAVWLTRGLAYIEGKGVA